MSLYSVYGGCLVCDGLCLHTSPQIHPPVSDFATVYTVIEPPIILQKLQLVHGLLVAPPPTSHLSHAQSHRSVYTGHGLRGKRSNRSHF